MTTLSAASTIGDTWNRHRDCHETLDPQPEPLPLGVKFSPPSLATLGVPQGKILIAVDDASTALDLQRLLHEAGYRVVGPSTTVGEVQRMIQRGDIDCAILDREVDRRAPLPIADLLAFADVPFVYLGTAAPWVAPSRHRHRPVVDRPFTREGLLAAVEKAMGRRRQIANDHGWRVDGLVVPGVRVYPPI